MHWVRAPKHREGYVQAPKYPNDAAILATYYADHGSTPIDPVANAITDDDIRDIMSELTDDWGFEDAAGEG